MDELLEALRRDNEGRDAARLALKYQRMARDPFAFFRGTCRLFYEPLPGDALGRDVPRVWACGDLHLENLGSYKGDNQQVYFDINDFDEALLAPASWDLLRVLASVFMARGVLGVGRKEARALCRALVSAYGSALSEGTARWVERETAEPPVATLLQAVLERRERALVDARTRGKGSARRIRADGEKALPASAEESAAVRSALAGVDDVIGDFGELAVCDVARRIAGTGSLGVARFVVLVRSKKPSTRDDGARVRLLDLKLARPPTGLAADVLHTRQPAWTSDAARIVALQRRLQAVPIAWLHTLELDGQPYVVRRLLPSEDRVELRSLRGRPKEQQALLRTVGQCLAWAQLRSSGRAGSSIADALIAYGSRTAEFAELVERAEQESARMEASYAQFCRALQKGTLNERA